MDQRRQRGPTCWWPGTALAVLVVSAAAQPEHTLVLANRNVPESSELASYYMERRGIPETHLCVLDLPTGEVISRAAYERRLRDPLLRFLREGGLVEQERRPDEEVLAHESAWITSERRIAYIVSVYGVPLRIADTKLSLGAKLADRLRRPGLKNAAALDSELSLLLAAPYPINGARSNPLFRSLRLPEAGADSPVKVVMAARLDGPSVEVVRRMIDDALAAERFGIQGRAYFDARSKEDEYILGDFWIDEAYHRMRRAGYDCLIETNEAEWGRSYPMSEAAFYMGWYAPDATGPFEREAFTFQQGAVAYHIHSGSAVTLRSTRKAWAGPLLARGAAATMGAVGEPYLALTPDLQIFTDRLCDGATFGAAAYMATSHLSWQISVIGDPLYTPFRHALKEQIRHLRAADRAELAWAVVRQMNRLIQEGRLNAALELGRKEEQATHSLVLKEKLGDVYAANEDDALARAEYEQVLDAAVKDTQAVRVAAKLIQLHHKQARPAEAVAVRRRVEAAWPDSPVLAWLEPVSGGAP